MEDERAEELSTIAAIYPELVVDAADTFSASLELPVAPSEPLNVEFPAAPLPSPPSSDDGRKHSLPAIAALRDAHKLQHLPPIHLEIILPEGYPSEFAPKVKVSTTPTWIPEEKLRELEEEVAKLWEEYGQCQVLFSYIDYLQQAAERAFDLAPTSDSALTLLPVLKPALLEHDSKTRKEIFNTGTYDCGVCLEPKKGLACYPMRRCGHVFCLSCLQDFYNNCITEGDVVNVRCMDPSCGKERKRKTERTLHPKELLDMGIEEPTVRRYVEMKRKKKLEADKSTVYCPRTWCQAPARTNKYPPIPADLTLYPESDSEDELDPASAPLRYNKNTSENKMPAPADRLSVCSKCSFAFCRICYTGWHGEFARCWPRNPGELSEEEKASYEYIRLHTSPCPTCSSPTQKTMGCNHMKCFQCNTHFCYLCGAWLVPDNPYAHFNKQGTECYQQLWVLEEGDEGQGANFQGARRWEEEARRIAEEADAEEAERLQREEMEEAMREDERVAGDLEENVAPGVARVPEAPQPPPAQGAELHNIMANLVVEMERFQAALPPQLVRGHRNQQWQRNQQIQRRNAGGGGQARAQQPPALNLEDEQARRQRVFRQFLELAERDEEDGWDSDELAEDEDEWEIREQEQ